MSISAVVRCLAALGLLLAGVDAGAQQYSYTVTGSAVGVVDSQFDVTVRVAFNQPPAGPTSTAIVLHPSFQPNAAPQALNGLANCQPGAVLYTPTGQEPLGVPVSICRYLFRAVSPTEPTILLAGLDGPLVEVMSGIAPPNLLYNPGPGSVILYSAAGSAAAIRIDNVGGGSGTGAGATTTVGNCTITGGGAAFPTTSFNPGITVVGTGTPTPASIVLPACVPGAAAVNARLACTESRGGGFISERAWTLQCPAAEAPPTQVVAPPSIESQTANGGLPDAASLQPTLSADGLKLAFASDARNLTNDDANGRRDVFLRDRAAGTLTRLSAIAEPLSGGAAESFEDPSLSSDGSTAVFAGSTGQLYLTRNGVGRRINVNIGGTPGNGPGRNPVVRGPGPGDKVYFDSEASNLVGTDGNGAIGDVYVSNLVTGQVQRLSVGASGEAADGPSRGPDASDDGSVLVFSTRATNIVPGPAPPAAEQVVVLAGSNGIQNKSYVSRNVNTGQVGNANSRNVSITRDGRWMVFESDANNLVSGDSNGVTDVFRAERQNGVVVRVERASTSRTGVQGNGASTQPQISEDGQVVTFTTLANNLIPGDTNGVADVVVKRMDTGELAPVVAQSGALPNGASGEGAISGDGRTLVYGSLATNLVSGDTNGVRDIFSSSLLPAGPQDEPAAGGVILPVPNPPNASCPSGFFIASVVDGPGSGLTRGLFGMEVVLDQPGTRLLAGGLNFGGLIDAGQVGFAGFNFTNPNNEPQRITMELTGSPITSSTASLPVRITIIRQTTAGNQTVFETSRSISLATPYIASVDLTPGFYVATVAATTGSVGGAAEGQFYFGMSTSFIGRPGGGFQGGAVVGGYHAEHPFGGVSGFAGFCIGTPHTSSVRVFSRPTYGDTGARDLRLSLQDGQRRNVIVVPVN